MPPHDPLATEHMLRHTLLHALLRVASHIRESMVRIMVIPDPRHQSPFGNNRGEDWQLDGIAGRVECGKAMGGTDLPMDPSTCVFWCAVALGALVRGSPLESVSMAMSECSENNNTGGELSLDYFCHRFPQSLVGHVPAYLYGPYWLNASWPQHLHCVFYPGFLLP